MNWFVYVRAETKTDEKVWVVVVPSRGPIEAIRWVIEFMWADLRNGKFHIYKIRRSGLLFGNDKGEPVIPSF